MRIDPKCWDKKCIYTFKKINKWFLFNSIMCFGFFKKKKKIVLLYKNNRYRIRKLCIISAFSLFKISNSFLRYDYEGINNPPFFNYYYF